MISKTDSVVGLNKFVINLVTNNIVIIKNDKNFSILICYFLFQPSLSFPPPLLQLCPFLLQHPVSISTGNHLIGQQSAQYVAAGMGKWCAHFLQPIYGPIPKPAHLPPTLQVSIGTRM